MTSRASSPARREPWLRTAWHTADHHRGLTLLGVVGLVVAVAMALFGLPPVDLHGILHHYGIMGPFCGGTRAARYAAMGQWSVAWRYNPLGPVVVLAGAAIAVRAVAGALTRRWVTITLYRTPRRTRTAVAVLIALGVVLTVRQQMRVDLLVAGS